jgi:hypothetical protein
MTEQEWLACEDPWVLLPRRAGEDPGRKVRLGTAACCRRVWAYLSANCHRIVEEMERYADVPPPADWDDESGLCVVVTAGTTLVVEIRERYPRPADGPGEVGASQARLARDVLGNPFRPATLDRSLVTPDVASLAEAAYEHRELPSGHLELARLAVLSDALEESGVTGAILDHLRSPVPHVRGCWAVDLVLGRS